MKVIPSSASTAISSIHWPLMPSMPMYYEPLSSLQTLRQSASIPASIRPIIEQGISETVAEIANIPSDLDENTKSQLSSIALALIFLGNGYPDEAHDLITPLSWNEDTYFGGNTVMNQNLDPSVVAMASYTHSLVHRREGFAQGEFGMMGYQNAQYWANVVDTRNGDNILPLQEIGCRVQNVGNFIGVESIGWCEKYEVTSFWDLKLLHCLTADACRDESMSLQMKEFAKQACEVELKTLIDFCLKKIGYQSILDHDLVDERRGIQPNQVSILDRNLDADLAQSVANKISSAHIGAFQSSRCVTMRNVMKSRSDNAFNDALAAAAGVACRLLGIHSVKIDSTSASNDVLHIILPWKDEDSATKALNGFSSTNISDFYGGGSLSVGDAFAFMNSENVNIGNQEFIFSFAPCDASDKNAIYVDRLYGKRGDTPTSVLQWSKGTIHKKSF